MRNILRIIIPVVLLASIYSCGKEEEVDIMAKNEKEILDYLFANNIDAQSTASGLYYAIVQEGNGEHPTVQDTVTVNYTGYLTNGNVFDSSVNAGGPITFPLSNVIPGWQEGIPYFSKGGTGSLFIPSHLAYGSSPAGSIPPNAVIIFDVELIDF